MNETRPVHDPFLGKTVEVSNRLTDRLRGKYAVGPVMPSGEPEFGWQQHQTPPIQHEAADEIERLSKWTRIADAVPPQDNGEIPGERWFLTYHAATGTYDAACVERDLNGRYDFAGFAMGVSHWREITHDWPRDT